MRDQNMTEDHRAEWQTPVITEASIATATETAENTPGIDQFEISNTTYGIS